MKDPVKKTFFRARRIVDGLSSITGAVSALCIFCAAIVVTEGVITRKLFGISGVWQIELSVFFLIFSCFMGLSFVQKHDHHLNVDLVLIHLPPKVREVLLVIVSVLSCLLCGVLAWYAWPMWWEAFAGNYHSESFWGPPMWIPYFFLPFGMSLYFLQYIVYISDKISKLKKGTFEEGMKRSELKDVDVESTKNK